MSGRRSLDRERRIPAWKVSGQSLVTFVVILSLMFLLTSTPRAQDGGGPVSGSFTISETLYYLPLVSRNRSSEGSTSNPSGSLKGRHKYGNWKLGFIQPVENSIPHYPE